MILCYMCLEIAKRSKRNVIAIVDFSDNSFNYQGTKADETTITFKSKDLL